MPQQLLPQPIPDAPAPPPGKEAVRSRRILYSLVGLGIMSLVAMLILPSVTLTAAKTPVTLALSNLRLVFLALFEFDTKYGRYPDESTAPAVKKSTGSSLSFGTGSSNELFVQLLAGGYAPSEEIFRTHSKGSRRPDNIFHSDATALASGECGFAYIAGLSSSDPFTCPIVFGPVIPGTRKLDTKVFDGKAIILRLDGSATAHNIDPSGKIRVNGLDILDPRQPYWNGRVPDVKWPR
jgi:hypothetical protein